MFQLRKSLRNALKLLALVAYLGITHASLSGVNGAEEPISFNRDIKPILSQNCYTCHGPDENHRKGGLRLDLREGAVSLAASGAAAIIPEQPENSELLHRVTSTDEALQMPPAETGKKLTAEQVELLRRWIKTGAEYRGHWAFEAPQRPALPEPVTSLKAQSRHPIDLFIQARLAQHGLHPAEEASRETLIRRVALDLTGLPPTISEIDAFLADPSDNAYESMVDRFLNSPHYGERMAINWLDNARYADSNGFQSDGSRDLWAWRDWVIGAYNQNMPFDQFTVEQLAGDMLPNPTREQIIATGFNRNHRLNGEGGRIEAEWFVETVIDRVETTGLTWLGLTLNCCRCHDHKYDPISQREFYQLFAFFNSVEESGVLSPVGKNTENTPPLLTLKTPETDAREAELESKLASAREAVQQAETKLPEFIASWEASVAPQLGTESLWFEPQGIEVTSAGGATLVKQPDGSWLATGANPGNDTYVARFVVETPEISGLILDVFPDGALPAQSLGRGFNGNFVLTDIVTELRTPAGEVIPLTVSKIASDYDQPGYTAESIRVHKAGTSIESQPRKGWAIDGNDPEKKKARRMMLVFDPPSAPLTGGILTVQLIHASQFADHNVGRFRISASSADRSLLSLSGAGLPVDVLAVLQTPTSSRSAEQQALLTKYVRSSVTNPVSTAEKLVSDTENQLREFREDLPTTMVMKEGQPRDAFILTRGEYDRPADKVERGVPSFLPPIPADSSRDRLGLARWIVGSSNPLTARVWVNREWERFFGAGLVRTTENFGSQSEFPSHPELLDWLACEFMQPTVATGPDGQPAHQWDMKALQKLILMSSSYRQTSQLSDESRERDPENRLISRGPRFRLTGELIRDQALSVSGLLVPRIGGPSVRPYMPEGVWDETSKYGNLRNYMHDKGDGLYRRTLYTIWKRTAAPPTMLLFDAPNREVCTIRRSRTNTPLQALALLNEVTFVEAARALGARILNEGGPDVRSKIIWAFRTVTGRPPVLEELTVLMAGYEQDLKGFQTNPESAVQLLQVGETAVPEDIDLAELAAWTVSGNVLLNLDEFVTRE
ncbi:MAG: PSD1 domain-containing protein [Planctomyces sp.]|nr:PSD1 domain-containing protein [Planctomyces sp.]